MADETPNISYIERFRKVTDLWIRASKIYSFPLRGWWCVGSFAWEVVESCRLYRDLLDQFREVAKIFECSGSPLATAAEDYREVRRMQAVLARNLQEERDDHQVTKNESREWKERLDSKDIELLLFKEAARQTGDEFTRQSSEELAAKDTEIAILKRMIDDVMDLNTKIANRCYHQSELLSRKAEKIDSGSSGDLPVTNNTE